MNNQTFPIFPYNNPMQIPIMNGGSRQNVEDIPEIINQDKIIEKTVYYLTKDIIGSRIIQEMYKRPEFREQIFEKIKPKILDLSMNEFANYFIKNIIKDNDKEKIDFIYYSLKDNIKDASSDPFATYVVQELIKKIDENKLEELFKLLVTNSTLEELASSKNTNHVLQSLIENREIKENDIISEAISNEFEKLSIKKYGCFIIETLLFNCHDNIYKLIYKKTCDNLDTLVKDEFGNHIIHFFFDNKKVNNNDEIYQRLKGKVLEYSMHKYAVFTINKAILKGNQIQQKNIIDEAINSEQTINNEDCLVYLSKHNFGNFAVQHFLEYSDEKTRISIIKRIYSLLENKPNKFAKFVIDLIHKLNQDKNGAYDNIIYGKKQ